MPCFSGTYQQDGQKPFIKNQQDTISIISSKRNHLYAGIDNYLEINKKVLPFKNIIVEITKGMVMEDEGLYIIMVGRPGITTLKIYQYDNGDTVVCFKKTMQVLAVPIPFISFKGQDLGKMEYISITQLTQSKCFEVLMTNDFTDDSAWYSIKSISIGYAYGKAYITKSCEGSVLSQDILNELQKISLGKEIAFTFTITGTGDVFKRLEPIRIKLY